MIALALTTLVLAPWKGADLPTASAAAVKYQLTIKDSPGANVHLKATRVAAGWIAAFCDNRVCSPNQVRETIPQSGSVTLQFELIREDETSPRASGALIESDGGAPAIVPVAAPRSPRR